MILVRTDHHCLRVGRHKCGIPARQRVVPSELGYDYFYGNIVGEGDACVSSY
jgi:hypothetical protein